ncbi:GIY-YIG nuclease family protein [Actinomyces ruminis]|uniref:GIY-YIG domain-containing protein n=1 Tax=Actinomyces ruminis TaxID=1937003 RepID=A0ABX4M8E3_9ACTO|nr:GIY-YIG nuclease family protein [Actinomyces ruminis]PHP51715.1 hypothetical protein BW737_014700 [Actinomyces ruminis]
MTSASTKIDPAVRSQVADELGRYVYMLVDPRDGVPFYVGKGRGERFGAHGWEAMLTKPEEKEDEEDTQDTVSKKVQKIRDIRADEREPQIWILRYGMNDVEYTAAEAVCIDLLRSMPITPITDGSLRHPDGLKKEQLTNARRELNRGHGAVLLDDLIAEKAAPELTYPGPLLTIKLGGWTETPDGEDMPGGYKRYGHGFRSEWLTREKREENYQKIGESACGWWPLSITRVKNSGIEYAVAVHRGVTRALLRIKPESWEPQKYPNGTQRSAFQFEIVDSGPLFDELVGPYGHWIPSEKRKQGAFYWPR